MARLASATWEVQGLGLWGLGTLRFRGLGFLALGLGIERFRVYGSGFGALGLGTVRFGGLAV